MTKAPPKARKGAATPPDGALAVEYRPTDALTPYARNSRTHSDEQVAQIVASIREFGFSNPVLIDAAGGLIAGHGRVMAAQNIGMSQVPCIVLGHLSPTQRRAYVIADNKLALNAAWNADMLRLEIPELDELGFDLELLGFSDEELQAILSDETPAAPAEFGAVDESIETEHACPKCGYEWSGKSN